MASIDDLFKKPYAPSNKRKLDVLENPNANYKVPKASSDIHSKSNGTATVEDEEDVDDIEAGPALPPEEPEDGIGDEDGRFFGGGITSDTADALNYIDEQDQDQDMTAEKIDLSWLRKVALNFEKRISKNSELRAKFENDPQKFMGSEADLDADVKTLSILSEHPDLYGEFARLGCVASLVSLLAHENTDIAIDAIEIIKELTDEDVEAEQEQWDPLVDAMLDADLLNLLYGNILRFDEANESDRAGLYHILAVIENLSSRTAIAETIGKSTSFIAWLFHRVQQKEPVVSQNKQYSAEILAILLQSSSQNRILFYGLNGIDVLLQILSPYRKRDPAKGTEEEEYVENIFDSVTCCLDDPEGKSKFLEDEGIELCLIMLREGILSSMLRSLPGDSEERIRLLAKFVEKDYEKIDRTMKIRREYASKVAAVDQDIQHEKFRLSSTQEREDRADEWLSRRMDAGLYALQTADVVLAWLVAEDEGAKKRIQALLAERDEQLQTVRATLQEQLKGFDANAEDRDVMFQEMLTTLVQYLH
ncbi:MAG: hypothetical protein Q9168_000457 [Polycauliona sp. 1 TL-2023]